MRKAGLPVTVLVRGDPRPLPAGLNLSAYRIVQEALTNVLKHAGPASTEVIIRYLDRELQIQVTNDAPPTRPARDGQKGRPLGRRLTLQGLKEDLIDAGELWVHGVTFPIAVPIGVL